MSVNALPAVSRVLSIDERGRRFNLPELRLFFKQHKLVSQNMDEKKSPKYSVSIHFEDVLREKLEEVLFVMFTNLSSDCRKAERRGSVEFLARSCDTALAYNHGNARTIAKTNHKVVVISRSNVYLVFPAKSKEKPRRKTRMCSINLVTARQDQPETSFESMKLTDRR